MIARRSRSVYQDPRLAVAQTHSGDALKARAERSPSKVLTVGLMGISLAVRRDAIPILEAATPNDSPLRA